MLRIAILCSFLLLTVAGIGCGDGDAEVDVAGAEVDGADDDVPIGGCTTDADCDDDDHCTVDTCDVSTGQCTNTPDPACAPAEDCGDGEDNDGDGDVDCDDSDCEADPACRVTGETICYDGRDDDDDGLADCLDEDCNGVKGCEFGTEITCNDDGFDNDGDGLADCLDEDCNGVAGCEFGTELTCTDERFDNDGDGLADCADNDCWQAPACSVCTPLATLACGETVTGNLSDGVAVMSGYICVDGPDFIVEALGPELVYAFTTNQDVHLVVELTPHDDFVLVAGVLGEACHPEACIQGLSWPLPGSGEPVTGMVPVAAGETVHLVVETWEDGGTLDLHVDCYPTAESACADGQDEDMDSLVDCADPDCDGVGSCEPYQEVSCADGEDNDGDGTVDCEDWDCSISQDCSVPCWDSDPPVIGCGDVIEGDFADGEPAIDIYSCEAFEMFGSEVVYQITLAEDTAVRFEGFVLALLLEGTCESASCVAHDLMELVYELRAGVPYYLVLESFEHDLEGPPFEVTVQCAEDEQCDDEIDNDVDLLQDCADPDCEGELGPGGAECEPFAETTCDDRADNDGDDARDCEDPDCAGETGPAGQVCEPETELTCDDGGDNDQDYRKDCADSDCVGDPACTVPCETVVPIECGQTVTLGEAEMTQAMSRYTCAPEDEFEGPEAVFSYSPTQDGMVILETFAGEEEWVPVLILAGNCNTASCHSNAYGDPLWESLEGGQDYFFVVESTSVTPIEFRFICEGPEICNDGYDNNFNEQMDCLDPECEGSPDCEVEIVCRDGHDNDADGDPDCADADCIGTDSCEAGQELTCWDEFDNDGDRNTDCADPDCYEYEECAIEGSCADPYPISPPETVSGEAWWWQGWHSAQCVPTHEAPETVWSFTAEADGPVCFDTFGTFWDTVLYVREFCSDAASEIACNDNMLGSQSQVEIVAQVGRTYYIFVDGPEHEHGPVTLNTYLGPCRPPEDCLDGLDNDDDGFIDCEDPDCAPECVVD